MVLFAGNKGRPLATEFAYYMRNRDKIVQKYHNKYVVVSGNKVIAAYNDRKEAYYETVKSIPLGSFMIHHATEVEEIIRLSPFVYA